MKPDSHEVHLSIEPKWGQVNVVIHCGWAADNPERPCWPCDEYGERYDQTAGINAGCVYVDWTEDGLEAFDGPELVLRFNLASACWDGDGFEFVLGDQIVKVGSS